MKTNWRRNLIELALWLVAALGCVVLALLIGGCASTQIVGSGKVVESPFGYVLFCIDNPKHEVCPKEPTK